MNSATRQINQIQALQAIAIAAVVAMTTGCATAPLETPLAEARTVDIKLFTTPVFDPQVPVERDPQYRVGNNAGAGAAAGAIAGLECGPFSVICSPFGALVGAAGGAVFGATAGAITSLPTNEAEAFNLASANYFQTRDLGSDLKGAAQLAVISHEKAVNPNNPDVIISLDLMRLEWIIGRGNTVRLRGAISARVTWAGGMLVRDYEQESARLKVAEWTAGDGTMIGTELDALIDALVVEVVEDLEGVTVSDTQN